MAAAAKQPLAQLKGTPEGESGRSIHWIVDNVSARIHGGNDLGLPGGNLVLPPVVVGVMVRTQHILHRQRGQALPLSR